MKPLTLVRSFFLATFLGFLIVITVAVSGCLSKGPTTNATTNSAAGSSASTASAASNARSGDDASVVRNAFAQLNNRSFRLREDTNMAGPDANKTLTRVMEVVPPDQRHVVLGDLEWITIGNQRYTKSNGSWTKASVTSKPDTGEIIRESFHKAVADGSLKIQHTGTDTIEGQAADIYSLTGTVQLKETTIKGYTMRVWVTRDGLLRKVESTHEANKQWKSVVTYDYPPNIKIEAPIP
jgi:hypothetical protein